ncbi:DUF1810 domain-containing protein [Hyphomicrobium sp.]|uniref:DUF1810 domain-containing protein n=1 Tax=Hyphomicrobium sp. TaxID=82 RepID=UPI002D76BDDA|nr:DUF1810 domain-containing protein [Hyphomicrobium sp.]HET6387961.1 DUF1810 domain-containing protein [Hyphomicrobium sp.]
MEHRADPYDLERFVVAQEDMFARAVAELTAGKKRSHWMWFIFPQLRGLGSSSMAQTYGIGSYEEAQAYVSHPVLGPRLAHATALMLEHRDKALIDILGAPDNLKFHSSMTLFAAVTSHESIYARALYTFCNGPDRKTLTLLGKANREAS